MLTIESETTVPGLTGREITDFLLDPRDDRYRSWWPGTHLMLHRTRRGPGDDHVGDTVLMDEYVGFRRVHLLGEVIEAVPAELIVWQFRKWGLRLPARLTLSLQASDGGVRLRHTITAGWAGRARVMDPWWRLWLSPSFADAMDRHVRTEFPLLRDLLLREQRQSLAAGPASDTEG